MTTKNHHLSLLFKKNKKKNRKKRKGQKGKRAKEKKVRTKRKTEKEKPIQNLIKLKYEPDDSLRGTPVMWLTSIDLP